jgi:hypothetical protein
MKQRCSEIRCIFLFWAASSLAFFLPTLVASGHLFSYQLLASLPSRVACHLCFPFCVPWLYLFWLLGSIFCLAQRIVFVLIALLVSRKVYVRVVNLKIRTNRTSSLSHAIDDDTMRYFRCTRRIRFDEAEVFKHCYP